MFFWSVRKALLQPPHQREGFGMVGLPTERRPRFLHTPTTRHCNSFYKQMADARLEKIKAEYCWGKGLSAPLGGFWESPRRAAGQTSSYWSGCRGSQSHELPLLHSSASWPRFLFAVRKAGRFSSKSKGHKLKYKVPEGTGKSREHNKGRTHRSDPADTAQHHSQHES